MRNGRQQYLHEVLSSNVDAYERSNADTPAVVNPAARLSGAKYNPPFDAQFDVTFNLLYFTENGAGVYTAKTAAQILAAQPTLATKLPVFLFGQSDFAAGFAKAQTQYPVTVWAYGAPYIYKGPSQGGGTTFSKFDATVTALLNVGDLVVPFTATLGGVNYVAISQVTCANVAYGTLLEATSSDRFLMNLIRYTQNDTTAAGLNQFQQKIGWYKQTLFGKFDSDTASPNSFKMPENLQNGIIDIPLVKAITKEALVGTYLLYTSVTIQWSIFVQTVKKAGDPGSI